MAIVTLEFVKSWLNITGTNYDVKIDALIPLVEDEYLTIRNAPWFLDTDGNITYPAGSNITSSDMIGWRLKPTTEFNPEDNTGNLSSESIGSYSASFDTGGLNQQTLLHGYPVSITGAIKKFIRGV